MGDLDVISDNNFSDSSWEYFSPSPTIPFLDHQEIVETMVSTSPSLKESSVSQIIPDIVSELESDGDQLFSFELDPNGSKITFLNQLDDSPDFTWSDILSDSSSPVPLDEIFPTLITNPDPPVVKSSDHVSILISPSIDSSHELPLSSNTHHIQLPTLLSKSSLPSYHCDSKSQQILDHFDSNLKKANDDRDDYDNDDISIASSDGTVCEFDMKPKKSSSHFRPVSRPFLHNEDLINGRPGQRINLTTEERKLLEQMGVRLPSTFPLSRIEERALRAVRRKIRNKLSAQASRAKRQKYVLDLEEQLSNCNKENQRLRRRIADLEGDKKGLINHLNNLRSYLTKVLNKQNVRSTPLPLYINSVKTETSRPNKSSKYFKTTAGGTSLLVITFMVLMWTALVPIHQLALSARKTIISQNPRTNLLNLFPGRSRVLLSNTWSPLYHFMNTPVESNLSSDPYLQSELIHSESAQLSDRKSKIKSINLDVDQSLEASVDQLRKLRIDDTNNASDSESVELGAQAIQPYLTNSDIITK